MCVSCQLSTPSFLLFNSTMTTSMITIEGFFRTADAVTCYVLRSDYVLTFKETTYASMCGSADKSLPHHSPEDAFAPQPTPVVQVVTNVIAHSWSRVSSCSGERMPYHITDTETVGQSPAQALLALRSAYVVHHITSDMMTIITIRT